MNDKEKSLGCYKLRGLARMAGLTDDDINRDRTLWLAIDDGLGADKPITEQTTSVDVPDTAMQSLQPRSRKELEGNNKIQDLLDRLENAYKLLDLISKEDKEDEDDELNA